MRDQKKEAQEKDLGGHVSHGGRSDLGSLPQGQLSHAVTSDDLALPGGSNSPDTTRGDVLPEHRGFGGVVGNQTCRAVLLRLGGQMETVIEFKYPPPHEYHEPIRSPITITPDQGEARFARMRRRTFVRDDRLRSPDHKWWFVYNSGRTRSPFDAYVYREVGSGNQSTMEPADPTRSRSAAQK